MKSVPCLLNKTLTRNIAALSALAVMAFMLPCAARADINSSVTLSVGQSLSLDTGATSTSGSGDITFTGTSITFVGTAKGGVIPGFTGATSFGQITQQILQSLAALASASPIPAS